MKRKRKRLSFRHKLIFSYVVICCFLSCVAMGVFGERMSSITKSSILFSAEKAIIQTRDYLDYRMSTLKLSAYGAAYTDGLIEIAAKDAMDYPVTDQLKDRDFLNHMLYSLTITNTDTLKQATLYLNPGFLYVADRGSLMSFSILESSPLYQQMQSQNLSSFYCSGDLLGSPDDILLVHLLKSPNDYAKNIAAIVFAIGGESVQTALANGLATPNSSYTVVDSFGDIITSVGETAMDVEQAKKQSMTSRDISMYETETHYHLCVSIPSCGWQVFLQIPFSDIRSSWLSNIQMMTFNLLIITLLFCLFSLTFSKRFAQRLEMLIQKIRSELRCDQLTLIEYEPQHDDIDVLFENYNAMVSHVTELLKENRRRGEMLTNAELDLLHAQINPHFLFNTLDMVYHLSAGGNAAEASQTVCELATFYRISLSQGRKLITLREEIKHAQAYLSIQNKRFVSGVVMTVDIPEELMEVAIPRITLQPIVENAIIHGLINQTIPAPEIILRARKEGEQVKLSVRDNGKGIPADQLTKLLKPENAKKGYGLRSTHERLMLHFGAAFGLTVYSIEGEYTQIDVRIPYSFIQEAAEHV